MLTACAWILAAAVVVFVGFPTAQSAEANVAVAANFAEVVTTLQPRFESASGHRLRIIVGSTGKLYAQITHGAPFDVLLAADRDRPTRLIADALAEPDTRFTYAVGQLSLWSADSNRVGTDGRATLRAADFHHLAIANPRLAPYGAAARQTLEALDLWDELRRRIVRGENIGQVFAMVASGNAELGFVARSALLSPQHTVPGSRWDVPAALHNPIRQDAVLLRRGADNPAAGAFLSFLRSPEARTVIRRFGYGTE